MKEADRETGQAGVGPQRGLHLLSAGVHGPHLLPGASPHFWAQGWLSSSSTQTPVTTHKQPGGLPECQLLGVY